MPRTIRYRISIPPVDTAGLDSPLDWKTHAQFSHVGIEGRISISLDPDFIEWETHEWDDPQTGETVEYDMIPTHCSGLIVEVQADSPQGTKPGLFLGTIHLAIIEALDKFVSYVRLELGQYWVDLGPIREWGLWDLISHGRPVWVKGKTEEAVGYPFGGFPKGLKPSAPKPTYPYVSRSLKGDDASQLASWQPPVPEQSLAIRLLTESRKHLSQGDRRSASVEAVTAIEASLESFIKLRCRQKGVSANALDAYDKTHYIGDYLKLLLPLVLASGELQSFVDERLESIYRVPYAVDADTIIEWCVELNRARNDAVHKGLDPAFETIDKGVFAADLLVAFASQAGS